MAPDLEESFDTFVRARGGHFLRFAVLLTGSKATATDTYDVTFGNFGVRVSVTAPPASQVYDLGNRYVYINSIGELLITGPPRAQAAGLSPHS